MRKEPPAFWLIPVALLIACLVNCGEPCTTQKSRIVTPPPVEGWKNGQSEVLLDGYIRIADWNRKSITYESGYGYIKTIGPICGEGMPVWAGMHIYELNFHWYVDPNPYPQTSRECYVLDYVLHAPTGDYRP